MTTFGEALEALKQGKKAYRQAWHGKQLDKEMYVYHGIATTTNYDPDITLKVSTPTGEKELQPFLILVVGDQVIYGWLASQTDMLSEDWVIEEANSV